MSLYTIYNIFSIAAIILAVYYSIIITMRIVANKRYDESFGINTRGLRSWGRGSLYNRTESTPYLALNSFSEEYKMNSNDNLVDFGCGKGRVAIYIHDKYKIPVTGIELNELTYKDALENVSSYVDVQGNSKVEVKIEKEYAEKYEIKKDENKFFFFNPFDVSIFEKVVHNIVKSAKEHHKEVEIILYYPISEYRNFLNKETPFELKNEIKAKGSIGFTEKFLIYKFNP